MPKRIHAMAYNDKSIDPASLTQSGADVLPAFFAGKYAMVVGGNYAAPADRRGGAEGLPLGGAAAAEGQLGTKQAANPQTLSVSAEGKHIEAGRGVHRLLHEGREPGRGRPGRLADPDARQARDAIQQPTGGKNGWDADAGQRRRA